MPSLRNTAVWNFKKYIVLAFQKRSHIRLRSRITGMAGKKHSLLEFATVVPAEKKWF